MGSGGSERAWWTAELAWERKLFSDLREPTGSLVDCCATAACRVSGTKSESYGRVFGGPSQDNGAGTDPRSAPRLATALRACKKSSSTPPGGADACASCRRLLDCTNNGAVQSWTPVLTPIDSIPSMTFITHQKVTAKCSKLFTRSAGLCVLMTWLGELGYLDRLSLERILQEEEIKSEAIQRAPGAEAGLLVTSRTGPPCSEAKRVPAGWPRRRKVR